MDRRSLTVNHRACSKGPQATPARGMGFASRLFSSLRLFVSSSLRLFDSSILRFFDALSLRLSASLIA
jgi:hypothetical protein